MIEAVIQNQDNREHDLLDSDDYYQFEGGIAPPSSTCRAGRPRPTTPTTRAPSVR